MRGLKSHACSGICKNQVSFSSARVASSNSLCRRDSETRTVCLGRPSCGVRELMLQGELHLLCALLCSLSVSKAALTEGNKSLGARQMRLSRSFEKAASSKHALGCNACKHRMVSCTQRCTPTLHAPRCPEHLHSAPEIPSPKLLRLKIWSTPKNREGSCQYLVWQSAESTLAAQLSRAV